MNDWSVLGPELLSALGETLYMVAVTLLLAGLLGLLVGVGLYVTRRGNILENRAVHEGLNLVVNFVRPIPFIILLAALGPVTQGVVGTRLGPNAAIFAMTIGAMFAVARIVHTVAYVRGMEPHRSLAFVIGMVCLWWMLLVALWSVL